MSMHGKLALDTDIAIKFLNGDSAIEAFLLRLSLKKKGKPIPENDLWIASICIENKMPLISNDGHFKNIDNLDLKHISGDKDA